MAVYKRVIPRDLFNEATLLNNLGRLWILLETFGLKNVGFSEEEVPSFEIEQDMSSGSIYVENLTFQIDGEEYRLETSLNSREKWPLTMDSRYNSDFDPIDVFDLEGNLSSEMKEALGI